MDVYLGAAKRTARAVRRSACRTRYVARRSRVGDDLPVEQGTDRLIAFRAVLSGVRMGLDVAAVTSCGISRAPFRDWAEIDHWASQIADGQQAPDMTAEQTP